MNVPAPLRPWLWCALWSALIWAPLAWYVHVAPWILEDDAPLTLDEDRREAAAPDDCTRYLALGDSLWTSSFPSNRDLRRVGGEPACWSTLWRNGARALHYLSPRGAEVMTEGAYDAIVIQSQLLFDDPLPTVARNRLGAAARHLLRTTFGLEITAGAVPEPAAPASEPVETWRAVTDEEAEAQERVYRRRTPLGPPATRLLELARASAERVIVVRLRRAEDWPPGPAERERYAELAARLARSNVALLELDAMPATHFTDGEHANPRGAAVRLRQLDARLESAW